MKKIVFPTDFSDNAWSAIIYALKFYTNESCKIYLLHSMKMKVSTMSNLSNRFIDTLRRTTMEKMVALKILLERVNANANHTFEIILVNQDLKDAVEFAIKKYKIEMLVMGTKGASGAKEFFFGSNTVNIISKVGLCPVLAIPDGFDFTTPKKIAFPTDFNRFYDEKELYVLKHLAHFYNSEINVVHLNEEEHLTEIQEYNFNSLKDHLKEIEHHFFWIPSNTKKYEDIRAFMEKQKIDLLVMVNYKHSFIERITREPVIKKIGFQAVTPFLVIPAQN